MPYCTENDPNQDFDDLSGGTGTAFALRHEERERARRIVEAARSLDMAGPRRSTGDPIPLRRVLMNMIEEHARHTGHADLLRERIDRATGR